jgi:hypothetical protein
MIILTEDGEIINLALIERVFARSEMRGDPGDSNTIWFVNAFPVSAPEEAVFGYDLGKADSEVHAEYIIRLIFGLWTHQYKEHEFEKIADEARETLEKQAVNNRKMAEESGE